MKLAAPLRAALDETGLPWSLNKGGRHYKLVLAGRLVGVVPFGVMNERDRATRNTIAQIKRAARQLQGEP